jgi:hypothetical protein
MRRRKEEEEEGKEEEEEEEEEKSARLDSYFGRTVPLANGMLIKML